ncbi:MAG: hypothetical protein ACYCTB_01645 [bacterium]
MNIIPEIESPLSENYKDFLQELKILLDELGKNKSIKDKSNKADNIIIEQNFGFNAILLCKTLLDENFNAAITYSFNMRDKNRISLFSDIITLNQIGLKNIIISEGLHPMKTVFYSAKPVYDMDVVTFSSIIKSKSISNLIENSSNNDLSKNNGSYAKDNIYNVGDFNLGVKAAASAPADMAKIKKLISIGADSFIINSFTDNIGAVQYIKKEGRKVFIHINELEIGKTFNSMKEAYDKALRLEVDGLIVKIISAKTNILKKF